MAEPYKMPSTQAPLVDSGTGMISLPWLGLLREFHVGLKAEKAPGRVEPFWLSAADLADATKFVQAGATAGLGVGDYLGWAICNGNNGTPTPGETFPRWSTAGHDAAGASGGADSHTHDIDHNHPPFASSTGSAHSHNAGTLLAHVMCNAPGGKLHIEGTPTGFTGTVSATLSFGVDATNPGYSAIIGGSTASESAHVHTIDAPALGTTASGAADNRPAFHSWVPLMRI